MGLLRLWQWRLVLHSMESHTLTRKGEACDLALQVQC